MKSYTTQPSEPDIFRLIQLRVIHIIGGGYSFLLLSNMPCKPELLSHIRLFFLFPTASQVLSILLFVSPSNSFFAVLMGPPYEGVSHFGYFSSLTGLFVPPCSPQSHAVSQCCDRFSTAVSWVTHTPGWFCNLSTFLRPTSPGPHGAPSPLCPLKPLFTFSPVTMSPAPPA